MSNRPGNAALGVPKLPTISPQGQWVDQAACVGHDPDHWYLAERDGRTCEYARAICAACPVRPDCLNWALRANEWQGLWGGLSPNQRRDLTRTGADR